MVFERVWRGICVEGGSEMMRVKRKTKLIKRLKNIGTLMALVIDVALMMIILVAFVYWIYLGFRPLNFG